LDFSFSGSQKSPSAQRSIELSKVGGNEWGKDSHGRSPRECRVTMETKNEIMFIFRWILVSESSLSSLAFVTSGQLLDSKIHKNDTILPTYKENVLITECIRTS